MVSLEGGFSLYIYLAVLFCLVNWNFLKISMEKFGSQGSLARWFKRCILMVMKSELLMTFREAALAVQVIIAVIATNGRIIVADAAPWELVNPTGPSPSLSCGHTHCGTMGGGQWGRGRREGSIISA